MSSSTPSANLYIVSRQAELDTAYETLKNGAGGTILLEATDTYTLTSTDRDGKTDPAITIRSADPDNPATIGSVRLIGAENLTIENVHIHMDGDDSSFDDIAMRVSSSTNITIRDSVMTSDAAGPLGTSDNFAEAARLALVRESTNITFEGNEISNFSHGLSFQDSHDVQVLDNEITAMQGDGIRIAGVSGMLIEGNHIYDMYGATQDANHSDMIQLWGINTTVNNEDITIRENFLDTGNGANYQMIFGANNGLEQNGFAFSNILIEGNVLFGAHANAIAIKDTDHATVTNNTIIYNADTYDVLADGSENTVDHTNRIEIEGTNTVIENNISQRVIGGTDNALLTITSPSIESDYRAHFINVEAGGSGDLRDLMLRPDSPLNGTAGSWLTWSTDTAETLTAVADVTISQTDRSVVTLDAGLSRGPEGYVAAHGASFAWIFEDGSTASGETVSHDFQTAGKHSYELIVTQPDGTSDRIVRTIDIDSAIAVNLGFEGAVMTSNGEGIPDVLLYEGAEIAGGWLEIGGRDRMELSRETPGLFNLHDFNIGVTLDVAQGSAGTFLHLPRTFEASITATGRLKVNLTTEDGTFSMTSNGTHFANQGAHTLNFVYDGQAETLSLLVDGVVDKTITASGVTSDKEHWGFTLGARWGESVEARISDFYVLTEAITLAEAESTLSGAAPVTTNVTLPDPQPPVVEPVVDPVGEAVAEPVENAPEVVPETVPDTSDAAVRVPTDQTALFNAETFTIDFNLMLRDPDAIGTLIYLHDTLDLSIDAQGSLIFKLHTEDGWAQVASAPVGLGVNTPHHITLTYDAGQQTMQVLLEDAVVASGVQTGETVAETRWAPDLGHPWSEDVTGVRLDSITVYEEASLGNGVQVPAPVASNAPVSEPDADAPVSEPDSDAQTLLFLDFEGNRVADTSGSGAAVSTSGTAARLSHDAARGEQVLEIGDASAVQVARGFDGLYELDNFMISLDMRSDEADGRKVFGIHKSYQLDVVDNDFVFNLQTSEGQFELRTDGDLLADRDWHNVEIAYSDEHDQLRMVVDGITVAETEASGTTLARQHWGLDLGFRWGDGFDGAIDKFALMTDIGAHHFDVT